MSATPFLPTRPSPWAMRSLATVLIAVFLAAVAAGFLIRLPETVESRFVLSPAESAAPVRAPRSGTVTAVPVTPGDTVVAGAVLLVLRSDALGDRSSERASLVTQRRTDEEALANERARWATEQRSDAEGERQLTERVDALTRMVVLRRESMAVYREVVRKFEDLAAQGLVSRTQVLSQQVAANQEAVQLRDLESALAQARASLGNLAHERRTHGLAFEQAERRLLETLEKAQIRIAALDSELGTARGDALDVTAPCAGTVLRIAAQVPGAVVRDGEVLGEVSCADRVLQVTLEIAPGEVGRLEAGQPVRLLYDAFPYQRYGVRLGILSWVSPAAVQSDGRTFFPARVDTQDTAIQVQGKPRPLMAGMGGRAKIVVGRRALVGYVFEPLRQLQEAVADTPEARPQP